MYAMFDIQLCVSIDKLINTGYKYKRTHLLVI